MSLELPYGIKVLDNTPLDSLYGPYVDTAAAIAAIPQAIRYDGLTVMITGTGEYWWLAADLSDTGLVVKSGGAALTDGNGTTANGSAVDLGGTLSSSPTITGDYGINFINGPASGSGFSIRIKPELYTQDGYTGIVASPDLEITGNINFNSAWLLAGTQTFYDVDTATYTTIRIQPTIDDDYSGGPNTGNKFYGFYYNPTVTSSISNYAIVIGSGFSGFGTLTPTARLHIAAGTTTIPPFKLTTGTALTTPEDGTIEYHSSHLYFTIGSTRYQLDQQGGGSGDVTKVGTPADNQIGVWTGDGTIEGASSLTYDGANLQLTGDIGSTGTRITKGWFTDLQVTNPIAGSITGNAATASAVPFSGITAATGTNTINNAANAQEWQWNTLGAGTGLLLSSSITAAASNTNTLFRANQTGANATSTQTTYSGYFSNTKTGTSSKNIGLYSTATGGTTNWSMYGNGNIGLQIGSAPSGTRQGYSLFDNGATERGFLGITSSAVLMGAGTGYPLYLYGGGSLSGAINTVGKWQVMDSPDNTSRAKLYVTHAVNNTVPVLRVDGAIDTNLAASTEKPEVDFNFNRNKNFATGALTTQREFLIRKPTYSFTGASTLTDAYTMFVDGAPAAGSNATITNSWAAGFAGNVIITGTRVNMVNLPTSAAGLATGDIWNNSGVINIV